MHRSPLFTHAIWRAPARFYEDILGFSLAIDQGACRLYRVLGRQAYLGICQRDEAREDVSGLIFTLVTSGR